VPVLEVVVVLGVAVLVGHLVSRRYCIAPPVVLLGSGFVLGFIPALRRVYLPPEVVLFLFLPVLLYWESLTTSLREIRRNLRGIVMVSTVLVFVTAARSRRRRTPWGCPGARHGCWGRRSRRPTPRPLGCWPGRCHAAR